MNRPHVLYRLHAADGALLYIGITADMEKRLRMHLSTSLSLPSRVAGWETIHARYDHHTVEPYPDRASAHEAERATIRAERPLLNVHYNTGAKPQATYKRYHNRRDYTRHDPGTTLLTRLAYVVGPRVRATGMSVNAIAESIGASPARLARNLTDGNFLYRDLNALAALLDVKPSDLMARAEEVAA